MAGGVSRPPMSESRRSAPLPRPQARVICADFQPATFVLFRDPARSRTFSPQTDWAWYRRGPSARTACLSARTFERAIQTALHGRQTGVWGYVLPVPEVRGYGGGHKKGPIAGALWEGDVKCVICGG